MKDKQSKKIQCNHCGYVWITASEKIYVSCPSCLKKVKNNLKGGNQK